METELNNAMWSALLKECFLRETGKKRDVRFPAEGPLCLGGNVNWATMHLSAEAVVANMQDNKAAFEAWALVLIRWCGAEKVVMSWDEPGTENLGHYQRFLYRAMHFAELMNGRFVLATPKRLDDLRVRPDADPHLNLAGSPRKIRFVHDPRRESEIEAYLIDERSAFRAHVAAEYDIDALDRQFPVGVFEGPPQRGREIFTGGSSAIDLVGKDKKKGIWIFEIKKRKAIPVGALSEMLLYTLIAHDVRSELIRFVASDAPRGTIIAPEDLRGASRIHTRLTATDIHPLIDDRILSFLNEGAQRLGWPIDFALFDLTPFLPAGLGFNRTPPAGSGAATA